MPRNFAEAIVPVLNALELKLDGHLFLFEYPSQARKTVLKQLAEAFPQKTHIDMVGIWEEPSRSLEVAGKIQKQIVGKPKLILLDGWDGPPDGKFRVAYDALMRVLPCPTILLLSNLGMNAMTKDPCGNNILKLGNGLITLGEN